jgi:iron complex outermembrane recepter protein
MFPRKDRLDFVSCFRLLRSATSLLLALTAMLTAASAAEASASGTIAGSVTSSGTHNALQGALVSIPLLNRTAFTDSTGYFAISGVPAGAYDVVVSYSAFDESQQKVSVTAALVSSLTVEMKPSDTITMAAFTVASVREGQALSITEQRNADNIKNVTALDAWGVLPTQNVGELFTRLPGISFATDEDNLINNITVRGMVSSNGQSFTRLNIDGLSATGVGGNGRTATLHSFSASVYEQLEVIAAQTPDKRADSIGGQINLKTKSPLALSEKRRTGYNFSSTVTPSSSERTDELKAHPYSYAGSLGYSEVFDVLGGAHNLGVSVDVAHQQITKQFDFDLDQYTNVSDASQVYFRDYDKASGVNHRFIDAVSLRADYRWREHTTISARFLYNAGDEPYFHYTHINPFFNTNGTVYDPVTNPSGGIIAGSTATRTEIRATGNAQMLLTPRRWSFISTNPTSTLMFDHDFGNLKVDGSLRYSRTHWDSNSGRDKEGGQLNLRTKNPIGFILDNSNLNGRVFTQTTGDNVYDPASYASFVVTAVNTSTAPVAQTSDYLTKRSSITDTKESSGNVNASYSLATAVPISFKAGVDTITREVDGRQIDPRRWYLVSGTVLSGIALMPLTEFERNNGGQRLPVFDPVAVSQTLGDTTKWYEDVYYNAVQRLTSKRYLKESVDSAYIQGTARLFKKLTLLGGFRWEKTDDKTATYFNKGATNVGYVTTAVESDPYKRAARNAILQVTNGGYTKLFPSIHATYDIAPNWKARASWSTSYGRPDLLQLVPAVSISDTAQTVTIGNPDLKPQMAKNVDLKLEYYFKNNGLVSVTAFRKSITDYLPGVSQGGPTVPNGPDNGFDGNYGGYTIISPRNIGALTVDGLEFDFNQRLTFLPGALKGLSVRANYTFLKAEGDFWFAIPPTQTSVIHRTTRQIPGMVPHTANVGLSYTNGKFGASFDLNHTGEYADTNLANLNYNTPQFVQLIVYRTELTTMNVGFTYRLRSDATVYFNVNNLTAEGTDRYTLSTLRPRAHLVSPRSFIVGVTGQF